jgi:hypothetical protein
MDANLLLETLSAEDMDMWHDYSLFTDENIDSSLKDEIKAENIGNYKFEFSSIQVFKI